MTHVQHDENFITIVDTYGLVLYSTRAGISSHSDEDAPMLKPVAFWLMYTKHAFYVCS